MHSYLSDELYPEINSSITFSQDNKFAPFTRQQLVLVDHYPHSREIPLEEFPPFDDQSLNSTFEETPPESLMRIQNRKCREFEAYVVLCYKKHPAPQLSDKHIMENVLDQNSHENNRDVPRKRNITKTKSKNAKKTSKASKSSKD